jgi:hypothetical protein
MNSTSSTETSTPSSPDPISRRAYELWEQEGRPEGSDLRHWLQAEKELGGGNTAPAEAKRYTDQPQVRQASDSRPLQGQAARPPGSTPREGKRSSQSPFPAEKSSGNGNGSGGVATRRRA